MRLYILILTGILLLTGCAMETTSETEQQEEQYIYQEGHLQGYDYLTKEKTDDVVIYEDFLLSKPAGAATTGDKVLLVKRLRQSVYVESSGGTTGWVSVRNIQEMKDMFPEKELQTPGEVDRDDDPLRE